MWLLKFSIVSILPGVLLSLLMLRNRSESWFEKWKNALWFLPLPAGFLVTSLVMEILEFLHVLSLVNVLGVTSAFSGIFAAILWFDPNRNNLKSKLIRFALSPDRKFYLLLLTVCVYLSLTVFPFHFIFETTDCGVYVASGVNAFKTGSFRFIDPEVRDASQDFIDAFYYETNPEHYTSARKFKFQGLLGTGFFIRSFNTGLIEPRYFNLHPFWVGLFVEIFGMEPGVWLATPFLALCGFLGFILLAWSLAGWSAAFIGSGLYSIFVLQIWFGRYITTEMATQACILNGLAWLLMFTDESGESKRINQRSNWVQLGVTGLFLSLAHFTRIDSVLVIPATFAGMMIWYCFLEKPLKQSAFVMAYAVVTAGAIFMAATRFQSYTLETLKHVDFDQWSLSGGVLMLAIALTTIIAIFSLRNCRNGILKWLRCQQKWIWPLFYVLTTGVLVYGYCLRPVLNPPDYDAFFLADKTIRSYSLSQMTLRWMGWYLSLPGLIAAFIGVILLFRRTVSVKNALVWAVIIINMLYFLHKLHCTPYHYWGMRRYIIVVLPVLFIGLGYTLSKLMEFGLTKQKTAVTGMTILLIVGLTGYFAYDLRLITGFNHWDGAIDLLEDIASEIPDDGRLVMPKYPGCYLLMPLKLIHRKHAYILNSDVDREYVWNTISTWSDSGDRVFYMSNSKLGEESSDGIRLQEIMHKKPYFPRMPDEVEYKPQKTLAHGFEFWIYEIFFERD